MDRRKMGHSAQIHRLLRGGGHQHGVARGAAGHKVGMVAEDRVVVARHHARGNVHDIRQELAAHRIHCRDHQHQALGRGEGRRQCARLQRTVAGACSARLGLHLDHVHRGAEQVLAALGGPLVHLFRHRGGRCDRIDRGNLGKRVGHMGRGGVAVHHYIMFFHKDRSSPVTLLCRGGSIQRLSGNAIF